MQGISELPALLEFKNLLLHLPFSDISAYLGLEQGGSRAVFSSMSFLIVSISLLELRPLCFMAGEDRVCRENCDPFGNDCYLLIIGVYLLHNDTVVLEKTLESPLDSKERRAVNL